MGTGGRTSLRVRQLGVDVSKVIVQGVVRRDAQPRGLRGKAEDSVDIRLLLCGGGLGPVLAHFGRGACLFLAQCEDIRRESQRGAGQGDQVEELHVGDGKGGTSDLGDRLG